MRGIPEVHPGEPLVLPDVDCSTGETRRHPVAGRARVQRRGRHQRSVCALSLVALLALCAPAGAEHPGVLVPTPDSVDVLSGFAGNGYTAIVKSSARHSSAYNLFLIDPADNTIKINRPGTRAYSGGIDDNTLVYSEVKGSTRTALLYDIAFGSYEELPIGGNPDHPTLSGPWVLYADGSRRRSSSVRLYNRMTGEQRRLGFDRGPHRYVYAGQVAGDWATWGRVTPYSQEVYLTNISTGTTVKLARATSVFAHYDPAVTPDGTVYFTRDRPCHRHCPQDNTPNARNQLVERRVDGRTRVVADLPRGADTGYLYADREGSQTKVLYAQCYYLPHDYLSYGDLFSFTVSEVPAARIARGAAERARRPKR